MKTNTSQIRLNKFLAECGLGSRRQTDQWIRDGLVMVDGQLCREPGRMLDPKFERVKLRGRPVVPNSKLVYYAFYKPKFVLTTLDDPKGRPTVKDFLVGVKQRVFPVGRLDWESEGLVILTNDGELAQRVQHPKYEIPKTYMVKIDDHLDARKRAKLLKGVRIEGHLYRALHCEVVKGKSREYDWIKIVIDEGRNRQIRRMMERVGYDVKKLKRVAIGSFRIGKLKPGELRALSSSQVGRLLQKPVAVAKQSGPKA